MEDPPATDSGWDWESYDEDLAWIVDEDGRPLARMSKESVLTVQEVKVRGSPVFGLQLAQFEYL